MAETIKKQFFKKAVKIGNSAGVLLPKSLLGSDVRIIVVNRPLNIKRDITKILEPILEDIQCITLINFDKEKHKAEVLAISNKIDKHIDKTNYVIDIVPLIKLKKSLKLNKEKKQRVLNSKPFFNKNFLKMKVK
jgi:putative transposon-encoded protein